MPTENRSSNTEQMVSLPLDLVELALAHLPSDSAAGFELRELLAQPAAQHQREPYCWSYKIGGEQRFYPTDPRKSNQGAYAELMSDAEPLYRHPPTSDGFSAGDMADQGSKAFRDGQRALVLPKRRQWNGLGNAADNLKASGWNACLDEVRRLNETSISPE